MKTKLADLDVKTLFRCPTFTRTARNGEEFVHPVDWPDVYIRNDFIGGLLRTKGNGEGQYPDPYLYWIESVFGREPETMEVCSRYVKADGISTRYTVDINPKFQPTFCTDAQTMAGVPPLKVKRIRADPPYNEKTAKEMYGVTLPDFYKLLEVPGRFLEVGGLYFLLLGMHNYQINVERLGLRRIGLIALAVVPNYEMRACNVFYKFAEPEQAAAAEGYQGQLALGEATS